jgi:excisionase family DNA binding protein
MTAKQWYRIEEVAKYLSISPRTVRRYIDAGYMEGVYLPHQQGIRIPAESLEVFLGSLTKVDDIVHGPETRQPHSPRGKKRKIISRGIQ